MTESGSGRRAEIHVATSSSDMYLPYAAALAVSLLDTNPDATFHLLHGEEVGPGRLAAFGRMVRGRGAGFVSHQVDDSELAGLPVLNYISEWYPILLPRLLPDVERCLYLDCDTLVLDSLGPLWELPLGDNCTGAVEGVPAPNWELRTDGGYFNSGVMLLNLGVLRSEPWLERIAHTGREMAGTALASDQDVLNVVFRDRWLALPPRWNAQYALIHSPVKALTVFSQSDMDEALDSPAIMHFEGSGICKPWHYMSPHPQRQLHRDFLARTPWPDTPQLGAGIRNRLIVALLPERRRIPAYLRIEQLRRRLGLRSDLRSAAG